MESHVLNTYHQARYRTLGHKRMGSTSESVSSENSPEYAQQQAEFPTQYEGRNVKYWGTQPVVGTDWHHAQVINTSQPNQDSSSDEEDTIEHNGNESSHHEYSSRGFNKVETVETEDDSLVEGADYDVIQVFAVHPDLDLEASSDDEQEDFCINDDNESEDGEYLNVDDKSQSEVNVYREEKLHDESNEGLNISLDSPVVSNVDEYFIKNEEKENILEVLDEPVVKDVDEYFIKEVPKNPNVDEFFIKNKVPVEDNLNIKVESTIPIVDDILKIASPIKLEKPIVEETTIAEEEPVAEPLNESDLEALPNIEEIKRYLLGDMPYSKFKTAQRSFSVPHSPMRIGYVDIDDAKTCLSFEDLNLDLSDLSFDKDTSVNKSDDVPHTLTEEDVNSFLITNKIEKIEDDLSQQDMEIENTVDSIITDIAENPVTPHKPPTRVTSTPIQKPNVLDFCIERTPKEETIEVKADDDFVDVESCNDTVIPVLEANNLNSLLEQFEASEKMNTKKKQVLKPVEQKVKTSNGLTNGTRLQDAGVQLNKNKMRHILMPTTTNTAIRRSPSPVHSDHDYCSSKKRHSLPNIKGGQSLLKPEVLSSNSKILSSRHRSCKNKKVVYRLSSDDESESNKSKNKKLVVKSDDSDVSKKNNLKTCSKTSVNTNFRKKLSPEHCESNDTCTGKINNSVMEKNASKASDNSCSQNSSGSLKLTIKNKSEVILNSCDDNDSQKDIKSVNIEKCKSSSIVIEKSNKTKTDKNIKELDSNKSKNVNSIVNDCTDVKIKKEPRPKDENFYTALFSNEKDVQLPKLVHVKSEKRSFEDEMKTITDIAIKKDAEQPVKRKKLNLQEYKLRKGVCSNNSSATVSPEAIFPDMSNLYSFDKLNNNAANHTPPNAILNSTNQKAPEAPKKIFDPIREASRKILMNTKKQKAEATRKRDEDIVMSKIPKVENLQLQPLISDAEMLKIVGMAPEVIPPQLVNEKPKVPSEYEEIVLVSIGTNTDEKMFKHIEKTMKKTALSPNDPKSMINFKIKKTEPVIKQNVFDVKKDRKSPFDEMKNADKKMDKERYKDITATIKSVEKQVDTKISSNSLFASIQDTVLKKAPNEIHNGDKKLVSPSKKHANFKYTKTAIIRDYDTKADHGEDKVIIYLGKHRRKPEHNDIVIQTDPNGNELSTKTVFDSTPRKRNDSDMSMSSESSPVRKVKSPPVKSEQKTVVKSKKEESRSIERRSRSRDTRYESKYRRRTRSRSRRRRRSRSRSRSRSRCRSRSKDRYRRYRRSLSPCRRKRSYKPRRRSPSPRRERARSRQPKSRSKSPIVKKLKSTPPRPSSVSERKSPMESLTPPLRKPTISESSNTSSSSSSSSSSGSSRSSSSSEGSRRSVSSSKGSRRSRSRSLLHKEAYANKGARSYSSDDRESNTPVEERRIVFVGRLEQDISKAALRAQFIKFGSIIEIRLHSKEDGSRYGFVTFGRARDAWSAVEAASTFPHYDVGFGGRRAFCRQTYADLDGLEATYTESAFHGQSVLPARRNEDMSFEQMLLEMKKKLSQRKSDKRPEDKP